jgi:hypothetical protein
MNHAAYRRSDELHQLRAELDEARAEIKRQADILRNLREWREHDRIEINELHRLVVCLLENDPSDDAADGVTVLQAWRKEAREVLDSTQLPRSLTR